MIIDFPSLAAPGITTPFTLGATLDTATSMGTDRARKRRPAAVQTWRRHSLRRSTTRTG